MSVRITAHVRQRISERAGIDMSDQDVLDLIPWRDQARIAAGEEMIVRVPRLKIDIACREGAAITVLHSHRHNRPGATMCDPERLYGYRDDRRPDAARTRQAHLDAGEEIVVGGRVRRIQA